MLVNYSGAIQTSGMESLRYTQMSGTWGRSDLHVSETRRPVWLEGSERGFLKVETKVRLIDRGQMIWNFGVCGPLAVKSLTVVCPYL